MSTLDIIAEVLREVAPRALKAKQIVELAGNRLPTASLTPETVVSRDLALDAKSKGPTSRFLRAARGMFLLKEGLASAFYNDNDVYVAQWTRNLIAAGELAAGVVDERSIKDLTPADVAGYRQCHFFAGIGVWSRALREAGWPDDASVWSGSCPCQPLSQAGRRRGFSDKRHLWPEWFRLITSCRPACVVGEQVSSKDGLAWFDLVRTDLEGADYAVRALDIPAAGVGAPHQRQRLYFAAYARERGREILDASWIQNRRQSRSSSSSWHDGWTPLAQGGDESGDGSAEGLSGEWGNARCTRLQGGISGAPPRGDGLAWSSSLDGDESSENQSDELGDSCLNRAREHSRKLPSDETQYEERGSQGDHSSVSAGATYCAGDRIRVDGDPAWNGAVAGFWAEGIEWIYCRPTPGNENGCFRPVESGTQPLVDGLASSLGRTRAKRLRGFGNAIVLPLASAFLGAVIDSFVEAASCLAKETDNVESSQSKAPCAGTPPMGECIA